MKKVVLTIIENENGQLDININFGKGGLDEESIVHKIALFAVEKIDEALKYVDENEQNA